MQIPSASVVRNLATHLRPFADASDAYIETVLDAMFPLPADARVLSVEEAPAIHRMAESLAKRANLPKPRLYAKSSHQLDLAARAMSPRGLIFISSAVLQRCSESTQRAGLAHELGHIKSLDSQLVFFCILFSFGAVELGAVAAAQLVVRGFSNGPARWALLGCSLGLMLAGPLIARSFTARVAQSREYHADTFAAELLGGPNGFIDGLNVLTECNGEGASLNKKRSGFREYWRTHPPTHRRVENLLSARVDKKRV